MVATATPQTPPLLYRTDSAALVVRTWPGEREHAVFNCASGDVHLLNDAALSLLQRLGEGPASVEELCNAFNGGSEPLQKALESLDRLGLVHPLMS